MLNGLLKALFAFAVVAAGAFAVFAVLERMGLDERAAEHRALMARAVDLDRAATAPGSALACLDAGAGDAVETACEKAVFADARSVAAAVAYTAARLALVNEAFDLAQRGDTTAVGTFAGLRRAIELDRYGLVAQVLTQREGCTVERCPAFAALSDSGMIKANIKARVFDQYVSRHAVDWDKPASVTPQLSPQAAQPPGAQVPPPASIPQVSAAPAPATGVHRPVDSRWDFPSAASIPPVSIMNAEPKLPPNAAGAAPAPGPDATGAGPAQPPASPATVPVPPKRPQVEATPPPPAR